MKIRHLFINDKGELSASKTIQVTATLGLIVALLYALKIGSEAVGDLGYSLAFLACGIGTSKGVYDYKTKKDQILAKEYEEKREDEEKK